MKLILTKGKNVVTWESNNQNVKAKDVVGNHWKMEAKLLGVSSLLRKVKFDFSRNADEYLLFNSSFVLCFSM